MSTIPSIVGLIPARSGSTRIPGKNTRRLGEHPLIAYAIASALEAGIFGTVIVSTEDEPTAGIARYYGAEVPFLRPAEMAGATSPDIERGAHVLQRRADGGRRFECYAILRPTSPFRRAATIERAWKLFLGDPGVDSLRAVEAVKQHPGKMWIVRGRRLLPLLPFGPKERPWHSSQTQSLPEVVVQNASLEIAWARVALEQGTIAGETIRPFFTDEAEGFDINDASDWQAAQEAVREGRWPLTSVGRKPYARTT